MEYIKKNYYNNKYLFYSIIAVIILIIGILVYFLIPSNSSKPISNSKNYQLVLFGDSEIVIYKDDSYEEIGYYAILNNEIITDEVVVNNLVDTSKIGTYEITYEIGNIKKTRIVKVIENPNSSIEDITFELVGDSTITLVKGEKYQEFGVKAVDKNNNNIASKVVTTGSVDSNKEGTYTIIYSLTINGETKTLKRVVEVSNKNEEIKFYLLGNSTITLKNGEKYQDPGYLAYDKNNNNISSKVVVSGNVNSNKAGTYVITYTLNVDLETKVLKRTVIVSEPIIKEELKINLSYSKNYTNKDVVVSVSASGTDYSYLKLPNGQTVSSKTTTYSVSSNGTYTFYAYDKSGNYKSQTITINNIDKTKPTATCTAKSYSNKTEITVKARDNLGIDRYVYNGSYSSKLSTYTINSKLTSVNVIVYDAVGNTTTVNCSVSSSKIQMYFLPGVSDDDVILIRTDEKTIMIDGGRWEGKDKVVSSLKNLGVTKIDALIGSHVHWNHVQAHAAILDNFTVDKLYYPVDILKCTSLGHCKSDDVKYVKDKIKEKNKTPIILYPKDKLTIGDMELFVIGPTRGNYTTWQNANSSVFILKYGNNKFMFTGDTPGEYMNATKFLENAKSFNMDIDIDVLKWPHHGYDDSKMANAFFEAATPKYTIVPRYYCSSTWPTGTIKKQLENYGVKHYEVCQNQGIYLESDGNTISIKEIAN